jgi:phospholipid/cholesterol/gamma-HCH transport system substrate-binding protein
LVRPGGLRGVLAFVLPAVIGVILVGAVIAWKQELFLSRTPIYVFSDSAIGITKGMPVKVFGLTIGTVSDIEIVPGVPGSGGRVRMRFDIGSEFLQHITRDSKARLMREALVGQSLIEIVPGSPQSRPVARNEVIVFERSKSLGELSEELNKALSPVLAQVKEALADIRNPEGQVQKSVAQVNVLLQELPETNRKLQKLMDSTDRAVGNANSAVARAAGKAETAMGEIEKTAGALSSATPGLLLKIDQAVDSVARTSDAARKLAEESSRRVPLLIDEGNNVVRDAGDIMTGARQSWPLRILLPQPAVKTLPIDTQETSGRP